MIRASVLASLLVLPAAAVAEVYRCEDSGGATVFSDQPCGAGAEQVEIREHYQEPDAAAKIRAAERRVERARKAYQRAQRRQAERKASASRNAGRQVPGVSDCPSRFEIRQAIRDHQPALCMTRREVEQAEPLARTSKTRYNELLESGITVEVWFYTRHRESWPTTLYFRADHLAAIEGFIE